ncbi:hypothetical protein WME89_07470 [Sorangium sp. So ce321]|uniref:hypothetical protein n=1 Tax=Sorangium sp. So ce321 TaxID=3133300 RepID=UPI003F5D89B1
MSSVKHCAVGILFLTVLGLSFTCGGEPYVGADCATTNDCLSDGQSVPGTVCIAERCDCAEPGKVVCCARGEREPDCFLMCRPCDECAEGTAECSGVVDPSERCESDAECPGPPDPRCGAGRCVEGKCELEIKAGRLASQLRGDCQQDECTEEGIVVSVPAYDVYNDGNQCTNDLCDYDRPLNALFDGVICPISGAGRCHEGRCVECLDADPTLHCAPGLACDGVFCVPAHCVNMVFDAGRGETAQDCGGPCKPCRNGDPCDAGADCQSGVCAMAHCKAPTCSDGAKNGDETGVDCSGACPRRCPDGGGCESGEDCVSGVCWAGACEPPSCKDGVENGDELGVDCGGKGCDAACPG